MDDAFSERLRQALDDLILCPTCGQRRWTMHQIALASGIPDSTMRYFMSGHQARLSTVDRLLIFLRDNGVVDQAMSEPFIYRQRRMRWVLAFQLFWEAVRGRTVTVEMSYGYPPVTHYVTGVHRPWYELL